MLRKSEYEEQKMVLEKARQKLLSYFATSEVEATLQDLRPINGWQFKQMDDMLVKELEQLELKWKMVKVNYAMGAAGKSGRVYQIGEDVGIPPKWVEISESEYKRVMTLPADQGGGVVRRIGKKCEVLR